MSFLADSAYYYFLLKLFASFIIGGTIITAGLMKIFYLNNEKKLDLPFLFVVGIGLAPYLISLLLNYLFLLLSGLSDLFYFSAVLLIFISIAVLARKELMELIGRIASKLKRVRVPKFILISALISIIFLSWSSYINLKPISEHDTLEYAVQGKVFYETKNVEYSAHNYNPENGFYYVGLHGYSFPLLASWERILDQFSEKRSDLFFRSINSAYGLLIIVSIAIIALRLVGSRLAIMLAIALPLSYGFYETLFKYHIDFYRIFFLNISLVGMVLLIRKPILPIILVLGILLGAQANTHSLGAMLYVIELGVIFLFLPFQLKDKLSYSMILLVVSLFSGSIHYVLDIVWGTGWIFQDLKFY